MPHLIGLPVVSEESVQPAVAIEIPDGDSPGLTTGEFLSCIKSKYAVSITKP